MSGEEIEPIKEAGEAAAALADVLIDRTGAALVPRAYFDYLVTRIHYRHLPKLIDRAIATAAKIKQSGLPANAYAAVDDPLLTAILEGAAEEDDPELQKVWENLLANALTDGVSPARRAYSAVLRQLEPDEALMLDRIASGSILVLGSLGGTRLFRSDGQGALAIGTLVNLERLNLIELGHPQPPQPGKPVLSAADVLRVVRVTQFGLTFVHACRPPKPPPAEPDRPLAPDV